MRLGSVESLQCGGVLLNFIALPFRHFQNTEPTTPLLFDSTRAQHYGRTGHCLF